MKLFLFGGAEIELGQVPVLKALIKKVIVELKPESVLHVPFARLKASDEAWKEGWFNEELKDTGITVYDARVKEDIDKAVNSIVFINGGSGKYDLMNAFETNKKLRDLVMNAKVVIAESAGSLVMGEYLRASRDKGEIVKGLGILKDTILEAHYSELKRQDLLVEEMEETGMEYGIGIDCATGIVIDTDKFPEDYDVIGNGIVEVITID